MEFRTVADIISYVMPRVNRFRQFPSCKDVIVEELKIVFETTSPFLELVVKDGTFSALFLAKMGKGRMRALYKLLINIDRDYYKIIDFKCD